MKGTKSKRREMTTLLCSLGAIAIGGIAADAWAAIVINNGAGRHCYICENVNPGPGFRCNDNNFYFRGDCAEGERATCKRNGFDSYEVTCAPCNPAELDPCDDGDLPD